MFPLSQEELQKILSTALCVGGQYADIFLEDTHIHSLELQDGTVSQAQQTILYGAGIRVLQGAHTGYAYTMDLSLPAMLSAARFASSICDFQIHSARPIAPQQAPSRQVCENGLSRQLIESSQARDVLIKIDEAARAMDARVIRVKAILAQRMQYIHFINSEGLQYTEERPRTTLFLNVVMQEREQTQMGYASRSLQMGTDFVTSERINEVVKEAISRTSFLFEAKQIPGGEMPVVMAAGASGIFMHEALGHAFEADFIRTGDSIFTGRLGEMICHPSISIVDDGTIPFDAGHLGYDDEGTPSELTTLVDHGRLNSYLHDRISAQHFGISSTGNGRRESFRHAPQPRMRSTYMLNGDTPEEDIIRSVKHGIYAMNFTNGQVEIGAGNFTFYMKNGYLIEDGRLTQPLRDMNIIGNGPQALQDITMVGNNLRIDHSAGMCGKGGQNVPVSQGLPTVLIKKLVVG